MEDAKTTERPSLIRHMDELAIALNELAALWHVLFILDESNYNDETVGNVARIGERISRQAKGELDALYETYKRTSQRQED